MKTYVGTKRVMARPMSRGEYNEYRGCKTPENESPDDNGYLVEYTDGGGPNDERHAGCISWSPKDVFDRAYHEVPVVDFNDEKDVEKKISKLGLEAPRLRPRDIDNLIVGEQYHRFDGTNTTVCCLTLKNGFTVIGESACISADNFNEGIGRGIARANARDKIWALAGYAAVEKAHSAAAHVEPASCNGCVTVA